MPQKKYPFELRERAVRMVLDALEADPAARRGIFRRIDDQLGVNPETLRSWVNQDQIDAGDLPGATTADAQRIKDLEKENRELRRTNQILKSASLFRISLDRFASANSARNRRFSASKSTDSAGVALPESMCLRTQTRRVSLLRPSSCASRVIAAFVVPGSA